MQQSRVEVYVHMVWATYRRGLVLRGALEEQAHAVIASEAQGLGCTAYVMNGMADHVHLVAKVPSIVSVAQLAKQVKGTSSSFINDHFHLPEYFRWQSRYGCFSFARKDLDRVIDYVRGQKQHHADNTVIAAWEETEEEYRPKT